MGRGLFNLNHERKPEIREYTDANLNAMKISTIAVAVGLGAILNAMKISTIAVAVGLGAIVGQAW